MNGIFVSATRQHIGKTTVSLSLVNSFNKIFNTVGYIKPVGQNHIIENNIKIDKDVALFRRFFDLTHCNYSDMSPIIVDNNYTRYFIDRNVQDNILEDQKQKIVKSFTSISSKSDFTVVEGTGHNGVGSVIGLSNPAVASLLDLDILLVVNGGIGKSIDELELNKSLCEKENVNVRGVIVNKVIPEKYEQTKYYISKYLEKYDIPLVGIVPYVDGLDHPTLIDIEYLFETERISKFGDTNFHIKKIKFVDTTSSFFVKHLEDYQYSNTIFITHSSRDDIIMSFCSFSKEYQKENYHTWKNILIICDNAHLGGNAMQCIHECSAPILSVPSDSLETLMYATKNVSKLNANDNIRTRHAIDHYSKYIDVNGFV